MGARLGKPTRAQFAAMEKVEEGENQPKISQKSEECGEDRISALQNCLLVEILSRLPSTKDAVRTGTLSKRWEHVWTSVPILRFTSIDYHPYRQCSPNPNSRSDFFSLVDKTLAHCCPQLNLKKFEMRSGYDARYESRVNSWIHYAISHGVSELTLKFRDTEPIVEVLLDQNFFICSSFTDLTLRSCVVNPTGSISWKNLRRLCIDYGKLDEDLVENILSGSPVLETLELGYGHGYKQLNITSKSVKNLVISGYMDLNGFGLLGGNILKINAPNILSLKIRKGLSLRMVLLLNVSCLMEANLDFTKMVHLGPGREEAVEEMLKSLIGNLGHVKELTIGGACSEVVSRLKAKGFVFPSNVKFLETINWSESESESDSD